MFSRTDALYDALRADLKDHLDPYQFRSARAGMSIWPDATSKQVACHSLVSKLTSKLRIGKDLPQTACTAALDKFMAINDRCGVFSMSPCDSLDELLLGELKSTLWSFFNPEGFPLLDSIEELVSLGGVGPGASVSARGDDFYTKLFDSPLSFTKEGLLISWESTVCVDDRWYAALARSYAAGNVPTAVEGNKLSFVMKNQDIARTTCTEPTINMWFQLGIGEKISRRLQAFFGIDLSKQPDVNRELAFLASCGENYATLDLESASDSISLRLLEEVLPKEALRWLLYTRSPTTQLPSGEVVTLNMVSTMGNGFTFPLQTAIFAACVRSVYRTLNLPFIKRGRADGRSFAVFGDDIIVRKEAVRSVVRLLALCGFRVNESKSFTQGLFYESCGGDFYDAAYVRPFYIKRLETVHDFYKAINGLNRWSAYTGIGLRNVCQLILSWIRSPLFVPEYESDDAGLKVPLTMVPGHRTVTHLGFGLHSYICAVPKKQCLSVTPIDFDDMKTKGEVLSGKGQKRRRYNPEGLWLAFVFGSVRRYRINLRQRKILYTTKRRVSPCWDARSALLESLGIPGRTWSTSVRYNLT